MGAVNESVEWAVVDRPDAAPARLRAQPSWLINQAALPANRIVAERLARTGARRYHYALLAALDELGPQSQAEFSRRTAIDRSDMVAIVNELTEQGYVDRSPDANDGRRNVITITPAGRRHLHKLDRLLAGAQDQLLAPLSPDERDELVGLLTLLVEHHAVGDRDS